MSMRDERSVLSGHGESNGQDPIDALIDHVARQLVTGEPSSALRSSVRGRIERRHGVWSLVPAWGVTVAVAVTAVIVGRALWDVPDAVNRSKTSAQRAAVTQPGRVEPAERSERLERSERPERSERSERSARSAVPVLPEEESPIPPIAIEPLATVQVAVDASSGVMPIEIEPLQIEPLLGQ